MLVTFGHFKVKIFTANHETFYTQNQNVRRVFILPNVSETEQFTSRIDKHFMT